MTELNIVVEVSTDSMATTQLQMILEQNYLSRVTKVLKVEFKDLPDVTEMALRTAAQRMFRGTDCQCMCIKGGERWVSCRQTKSGLEITIRLTRREVADAQGTPINI
ncbi:hypothetical protein KKF59_01295 [Patescibacteria group bacterium]|nr:hypothetical protein [Patescibacteria group bacterium]MBU1034476.1 hypothetical protein [Patescibacteria group bacterium]MBU1907749.1 hypothetical protein [Patescibacteria group bacterium]